MWHLLMTIQAKYPYNNWTKLTDNAKTFNEQLGTNIPQNSSTYGLWLPAGVKEQYPERFQKISDALKAVTEDPEFIQMMTDIGEMSKIQFIPAEEYQQENIELGKALVPFLEYFDEE